MSPSSANVVGRQIGIGVVLVSFVTLVTFVFSFLGTILAGAMVGMMVGFNQRWRWQFLLISLVFPAALMASMPVAQGKLHDSAWLATVCFGVFWATYLLTRGLSYLEKRERPATNESASVRDVLRPGSAPNQTAGASAEIAPRVLASEADPEPACDPGLGELQGIWLCESTAPDGKRCKKVIEVAHQELALSLIDRAGKVRFLAKGDLTLEKLGAFKTVKVAHRESGPSGISAEELGLPDKWLYRVVGDRLTLAADFEESAAGREPLVETYVKSRER